MLRILLVLLLVGAPVHAQIYRWDDQQVIPGTQGISLGPEVNLAGWNTDSHNLNYADFSGGLDLSTASFRSSWLDNANFTGADLTRADFLEASLAGANLLGATVAGARFMYTTSSGFTKDQLYSTASYKAKKLTGINLNVNDLTGWDFSHQDLTAARLSDVIFTDVDLTGAVVSFADFTSTLSHRPHITEEQLYSTASYLSKDLQGIRWDGNDLTGWDFSGQLINEASFSGAKFTKEQLYSTASYKAKDLHGVYFWDLSVAGWDFSYQNLTNVQFHADMTGTNLTGAIVRGAHFAPTFNGFTKSQLYSTASYKARDLQNVSMTGNLIGWDFNSQDLTGARLSWANLTGANFAAANLSNTQLSQSSFPRADFTDAIVIGANLAFARFTKEQLYSTASYRANDLHGIELSGINLTDWDFSGQNLTNSKVVSSLVSNVNLTGADLRGATWEWRGSPILKNTILPSGELNGLNLAPNERMVVRNFHGKERPIPVIIHDELKLKAGGMLDLELDAQPWESTIIVGHGTSVALDGTLELRFTASSDALRASGQTLKLFDWTAPLAADNRFAEVRTDSGTVWDLSKLYTTGQVTLLGISSDLSSDKDVDSEDLVDFLENWTGADYPTADKSWHDGDADFDGDVDTADLLVLLSQWTGALAERRAPSTLAAHVVPEPNACLLGLGALALFLCKRRESYSAG